MSALALANGAIYPATRDGASSPGTLLIRAGRVIGHYPDPASAQAAAGTPVSVVDIAGHTVLPGFIDCHVHLCFDGGVNMTAGEPGDLRAAAARAATYLRAGVTTVRELGAPLPVIKALQRQIEAGITPGPRLVVAGPIITVPGGHGAFAGEPVADPARLPEVADRLADHGVDCLKVAVSGGVSTPGSDLFTVQFDADQLGLLVAAAHRRGLPVAAHASTPAAVRIAAEAGVDSVEHAVIVDEAAVAALAAGRSVLVPTLTATDQPPGFADDPRIPQFVREKARITVPAHRRSIRTAIAAGVPVAAGTDGGSTLTGHGRTAHEAAQLVACGLDPAAAIAALTRDAAALLGLGDRLGTLTPGALADVVVVAGDPLADVGRLADVRLVIKGGEIVHRADPPDHPVCS